MTNHPPKRVELTPWERLVMRIELSLMRHPVLHRFTVL